MTIYAVLAPPTKAGSAGPDPVEFVFVKEGFCWPAFYLTIPWLVARRLWLGLVFYVLAMVAVLALAALLPVPVAWVVLGLFALLIALEANNLRRWSLERRGYRFLGVASGNGRSEAELRFFLNWSRSQPTPSPRGGIVEATAGLADHPGEIVGLFPTAGVNP